MTWPIIAPFDRDQPFGGSIRTTAMAEGLESIGEAVRWHIVGARARSAPARLSALFRRRPGLVDHHVSTTVSGPGERPALVAHTYLSEAAAQFPRRIIDWHNVEWTYLASLAPSERGVRRLYMRYQASLMRAHEQALLRQPNVAHTFCASDELLWAGGVARDAPKQLLPHQLSRSVATSAERVRVVREGTPPSHPRFLYVGKLTYGPNRSGLAEFLENTWPSLRERLPEACLDVVGLADGALASRLGRVPGVRYHGFQSNIEPYLERATAAVLPFGGLGGSSVRVLTFAASGVAVVGDSASFRGYDSDFGTPVKSGMASATELCRMAEDREERWSRERLAHQAYLDSRLSKQDWQAVRSWMLDAT